MQTKVCSKCKKEKLLSDYGKNKSGKNGLSARCKDCARKYSAQYRNSERGKEVRRKYAKEYQKRPIYKKIITDYNRSDKHKQANERYRHSARGKEIRLQREFGITLEEYAYLFQKQQGKCAICGSHPGKRSLAVDHDHETNEVRSLLCGSCNTLLGLAKERTNVLLNAILYLRKYEQKTKRHIKNSA